MPQTISPRTTALRAAALLVLAAIGTPAMAQKVMKPGVWDVKTTVSIQLGDDDPVAMDHAERECLTKDFLAEDPYFSVQDDGSAEKDGETCKTIRKQRQGNQFEWVQHCSSKDGAQSVYQIKTNAGETTLQYLLTDTTRHPKDGESKTTVKIAGRLVSDTCPDDMPRNGSEND